MGKISGSLTLVLPLGLLAADCTIQFSRNAQDTKDCCREQGFRAYVLAYDCLDIYNEHET